MNKRNYRLNKIIVMTMMILCIVSMGGVISDVWAQTAGQILCTNNKGDYGDNAIVLNTSDSDFFSSTYKTLGIKLNPLELHIKEDTTLVINGPLKKENCNVGYRQINSLAQRVDAQDRNYLEGILVYPGKTLTIRLESNENFYVYGKKEPHSNGLDYMGHAGIEVPYSATLIIEQTKNVSGALIALGSSSKSTSDIGNGTGAGIGGRGYEFFKKVSNYRGDVISGDYTYADCGTVIIRSGRVYACGGCGVGEDGKGTGAGIGGGGIWKGIIGHGGTISSGRGGNIRIYGGEVEAYGGGTFNNNGNEKNIYGKNQSIFFDSNNGFYNTNLGTVSDDQAEGTGAGIGGGGLYVDNELTVNMNTELRLEYYGGRVNAFAGAGSNRSNEESRGVGAAIGGGGGYASDGDMKTKATFNSCPEVKVGYTFTYNVDENVYSTKQIVGHYEIGLGSPYNISGSNNLAMLGGWCCNGRDCNSNVQNAASQITITKLPESRFDYSVSTAIKAYPLYKYPKEAYSDIVTPKIESMTYTVDDFNDLENADVGDILLGKDFNYTTAESAIGAVGNSITNKSNLIAKIVVSDKDTGYIENFGYTIGHGIKEISGLGTVTLRNMFESYNAGKIKRITPNVYIKILEAGNFDSSAYGINEYDANDPTKDRLTFYASRVEVYIITREDFTVGVKDIGDRQKSFSVEVDMPEPLSEDLELLVQYILKTDAGGSYADMQESDAFDGVKAGETVVEEDLIMTVKSSLSQASDAIVEMTLRKNGAILATEKNTNIMTYKGYDNGTYVLNIKSKLGSEVYEQVKIMKIGEKKQIGDDKFPIPSIFPTAQEVVLTDFLSGNLNNSAPNSPSEPNVPGGVELVGSISTVDNISISVESGSLDSMLDSVEGIVSVKLAIVENLDKINWSKNQRVDWGIYGELVEKLRYKDEQEPLRVDLPLYQDSQIRSPLDTDATIYTNGNNKSYVVEYYTQNRSEIGNGYTTVNNYSGTYKDSGDKTMASTNVVDVPYEGDKAISIRCEYANGKVRAILEPSGLIVGSNVKEVGVRVEYELNGIITGIVHKWNYVEGQNGVFEWTFANVPKNNVKYSAYYINNENEEFSTTLA